MRILLVNTNRMKPAIAPIGLDYVADSVIAAGHEARLLDLCFAEDVSADIKSAALDFAPDVIGITIRNTDTCYFTGDGFFLPEIRDEIEVFRSVSDAPIVLGGVGFSVAPEAVMEFCGADYGIVGEGEEAFVSFLAGLLGECGLHDIPGLLFRQDGRICRNEPAFLDQNALPRRTRSFVDNPLYFEKGGQAGFETKRGCNMKCIYCADPVAKGRFVRARSARLVAEELKTLLAQGIDHFHTCDCEFNLPGEHAKDVCRAIIRAGLGRKIRWYAYCSVTPFDSEMADLFVRAGCAGVNFGADSGSAEMLHRLGRHFGPEDLANTAKLCRRHGITCMYDLLLGGPGETKETVRETIELMRRIDVDCVGLAMGMGIAEGTPVAECVRSMGDMATNPDLYGPKQDNPHFLRPVFYISPDLGPGIADYVRELVGDDRRFFLPSNEEAKDNYNYSDNTILVRAIANGARGAYWDILRKL